MRFAFVGLLLLTVAPVGAATADDVFNDGTLHEVRLTMVLAGPPEDDIDWADVSPSGSAKFLSRAWRLSGEVEAPVGADAASGDRALRQVTHRTVDDVTTAVETSRFNVAIARVMELVNATRRAIDPGVGPADPAAPAARRPAIPRSMP